LKSIFRASRRAAEIDGKGFLVEADSKILRIWRNANKGCIYRGSVFRPVTSNEPLAVANRVKKSIGRMKVSKI
jgi:hypothetical protein